MYKEANKNKNKSRINREDSRNESTDKLTVNSESIRFGDICSYTKEINMLQHFQDRLIFVDEIH